MAGHCRGNGSSHDKAAGTRPRPQTGPVAQVLAVVRAGWADLSLSEGLCPPPWASLADRWASYPPRHPGFLGWTGGGLGPLRSHQSPRLPDPGTKQGLAILRVPCLAVGSSSLPKPPVQPQPCPQAKLPQLGLPPMPPAVCVELGGGSFSDSEP